MPPPAEWLGGGGRTRRQRRGQGLRRCEEIFEAGAVDVAALKIAKDVRQMLALDLHALGNLGCRSATAGLFLKREIDCGGSNRLKAFRATIAIAGPHAATSKSSAARIEFSIRSSLMDPKRPMSSENSHEIS